MSFSPLALVDELRQLPIEVVAGLLGDADPLQVVEIERLPPAGSAGSDVTPTVPMAAAPAESAGRVASDVGTGTPPVMP